jgi:hypothetical protein
VKAIVFLAAIGLGPFGALVLPAAASADPGGTGRVIVMRPGYAQLMQAGVIRRYVPLPYGPVSIETLVRAVNDPAWASVSARGELILRVGISQRPGTNLRIQPPVRIVRLVDSPVSPAFLAGTRATVSFQGVTVTSAAGSAGVAKESAHRPYVRYLNGSTVSMSSARFEGLGSASTRHRGVTVGSGGVVTAVDTVFRASSRGLDMYRAARVALTRVSATDNSDAGVLINKARSVHLTDVNATDNAGTGLVLRGPMPVAPALTRVASGRNGTGVELSQLGKAPLGPLRTDHNRQAGIVLDRCLNCVLTGVEATGDRTGILIERQSSGASVQQSTVWFASQHGVLVAAGGAHLREVTVESAPWGVGMRVLPRVRDVAVESSTLRGGAVAVSTDGVNTSVSNVSMTGAQIGLRIGREADGVAVTAVRVTDSQTGLQANTGARGITVEALNVTQRGGHGIRSAAQQISISNSEFHGAEHGLRLEGIATVRASTVFDADEAVVAGPHGHLTLVGGRLHGHTLGLRIADSAQVVLQDVAVDAPRGARGPIQLRGTTELPAMPLRWIGVFGLVVVAVAVALEVMRRLRERRSDRTVSAPPHVTNIT